MTVSEEPRPLPPPEPVRAPWAPPSLPPGPPRAQFEVTRREVRPVAAGQLTSGWRAVVGIVWALVFVSLIAVWKTSRELGLNTWWLGPLGEPAPWFMTVVPFVPSAVMVMLILNNLRWLPWAGIAGAAWVAVVGLFDLDKVVRLGLVELAIAGAAALTSIASFGGRYRPPDATPLAPPPGR